jgi:uncharacterized membrane protein YfcA
MPDLSAILAYTLVVFLFAGFVKGVVGLGLPVFAVGLLGLVMAPGQAVALLAVPSVITNIWQLTMGGRLVPLVLRLWSMLLAAFITTYAGVWSGFLNATDQTGATAPLGAILILYGVVGLTPLRLSVSPRLEPWLSPLVGGITGLVSAASGVFSIPSVPYLEALGLRRGELVQALGLFFTASSVALTAGLAQQGLLKMSVAGTSLFALAAALAGMMAGQRLRRHIRPNLFRILFLVAVIGLGVHLALRGLL